MTAQIQEEEQVDRRQVWRDYADLPVGEILRRTRQHYNLSLDDVAANLRIRASHLGALESGRTEILPGRAYAIGFVRAYAEYLNLDGNRMVHLFKTESAENRSKPSLQFPVAASESKQPNYYILGASFFMLVSLLATMTFFSGQEATLKEIPPVPVELVSAPANSIDQPPLEAALLNALETAAGEEGPQAFVEPQSRIVIKALDSAWVEIRDANGKSILSRILKANDSFMVPDQSGLTMDTGNAGAVALIIDGGEAFPLGENGDVKRGVMLNPDALKPVALPDPVAMIAEEESVISGSEEDTNELTDEVSDEVPAEPELSPADIFEKATEVPDALQDNSLNN